MIAIISLLAVLMLSLIATRMATVALTLTGLSKELARFQARSAFSGCGFSTAESEQLMNHPVRRRILMLLMLLGNAGIITCITSLILAFVQTETQMDLWIRFAILGCGIVVLWGLAATPWVTRWMERIIRLALRKWTTVEVRDYASLLRLSNDFTVCELQIAADDWVAGRTLAELHLHAEGITVLGIEKIDGGYVGVATGNSKILSGDVLLLYGKADAIDELDGRPRGPTGDQAHQDAVRDQAERLQAQQAVERHHDTTGGAH